MLCTEGGARNIEVFKIIKHINFKALRYRWQKLILDYLSNHLPSYGLPKFKKIKILIESIGFVLFALYLRALKDMVAYMLIFLIFISYLSYRYYLLSLERGNDEKE